MSEAIQMKSTGINTAVQQVEKRPRDQYLIRLEIRLLVFVRLPERNKKMQNMNAVISATEEAMCTQTLQVTQTSRLDSLSFGIYLPIGLVHAFAVICFLLTDARATRRNFATFTIQTAYRCKSRVSRGIFHHVITENKKITL